MKELWNKLKELDRATRGKFSSLVIAICCAIMIISIIGIILLSNWR